MTSLFTFPGGTASPFYKVLTTTAATVVFPTASAPRGVYAVPLFRCSEYAGGTPNLTVEIYDPDTTTSYYLGSNAFTWIAKAVTAKQSLLFDDGYNLPQGWQIRVTSSVANNILVTGIYVTKQQTAPGTSGSNK